MNQEFTYHSNSRAGKGDHRQREREREIYLQPAALILFAYILPMSPMPMIPTENGSIAAASAGDTSASARAFKAEL